MIELAISGGNPATGFAPAALTRVADPAACGETAKFVGSCTFIAPGPLYVEHT